MTANRPVWVDELFALHGPPRACIEEPRKLSADCCGGYLHRQVWVWFINGRSHHITIDRHTTNWETGIYGPVGDLILHTREEPSDERCRAALQVVGWLARDAPGCGSTLSRNGPGES